MTDLQEQEINERLARFAGFKPVVDDEKLWEAPNGHLIFTDSLPAFTRSLDALATHVWPKLYAMEIGKDGKDKWGAFVLLKDTSEPDYNIFAATPAQACAEAVGKLLEAK